LKFGIVVFPGSNCDADCYYAATELAKGEGKYIWHRENSLEGIDCVILPGGFSYGDYLRAGALARFSSIMEKVVEFAEQGGLVMGICNGFQILLEAGLLPGAMKRNDNLQFRCQDAFIRVETSNTPFTGLCNEGQILKIPIAHGEGNYFIHEEGLKDLKANNQIVFRYSDDKGSALSKDSPNGSVENIAGIVNKNRNVLGMMPHPERSSEDLLGTSNGLIIFKSIAEYLKGGN
jgi:phosphoribosylformylglycinamidine synthase